MLTSVFGISIKYEAWNQQDLFACLYCRELCFLHSIYSIWYVVAVIAVGMLAVSLTKGILHYKVKQVVSVPRSHSYYL